MEIIKILFFAIGSFFGIENSRIASEKVLIQIDPNKKTILITQYNLFSIAQSKEDDLKVQQEFSTIQEKEAKWISELEDFPLKSVQFSGTADSVINAQIVLHYNKKSDLELFGIDYSQEGHYSLVNFPNWHLKSSNTELKGNYWIFEDDNTFNFTLEPFKDTPFEYKEQIQFLSPSLIKKK